MRRREFITLIGGVAVAWPASALGQEPGRTYRLGCIFPSPRDAAQNVALFSELRRLGFIEGQNLTIDWRTNGVRGVEQVSEFAAEMVKAPVDIIVVGGDPAIRAAEQATTTIPILGFTDDMVGSGLAQSLSRPGGNATGVSILATELDGKRQEILIEAVPGLRRMAALADSNTTGSQQLQALQDAARARGVELSIHRISNPDEIAPAIDAAKTSGAAALNVLASPLLFANSRLIMARAAALHLPAMYQWPEVAEQGGLIGYGPRIVQMFGDLMGRQLVKLLRGAKPAELPIEQPTKFELVINLKTANALGLKIPEAFLQRADKVID